MLNALRPHPDAERSDMPQPDQLVRLLRRAVEDQDGRARAEMMADLQRRVTGWLREAGCAEPAIDKAATEAWSLFWRACTPARLAMLSHEGAIHHYLQGCVRAAAPRIRPPALPDAMGTDRADVPPSLDHGPREEAVLTLRFAQGLSAAQIREVRPDLFTTEDEVRRTTRALLDHQQDRE